MFEMDMEGEIVNRVAASGIVTLELEKYHQPGDRVVLDLAGQLENGLLLREKPFREFIRGTDWAQFAGKHVAVCCTAEAIIPAWAYMLVGTSLQPHASTVVFGNLEGLEERLFLQALGREDWEQFRDARVVVKGCTSVEVPAAVYLEVSARLRPVAMGIMFGEACSSVPVFKKK